MVQLKGAPSDLVQLKDVPSDVYVVQLKGVPSVHLLPVCLFGTVKGLNVVQCSQ